MDLERELGANDRLVADLARGCVTANRAVQTISVALSDGDVIQLGAAAHKLFGMRCTLEKRKARTAEQLRKAHTLNI